MPRFTIAQPTLNGFLDELELQPTGLTRLAGWTRAGKVSDALAVVADGRELDPLCTYRTHRPDVPGVPPDVPFAGFEILFREAAEAARELCVRDGRRVLAQFSATAELVPPAYRNLFDEERVLHRANIYGVGPPDTRVNASVLALVRNLRGPLLDFGCGSGALVRELRRSGVEAYGIDLNRPEIESSLVGEARPYVRLYDGTFPLPFEDGAFQSVVCTEVLEHIEEYRRAVGEIARVCSRSAVVTVPDMAAIPSCFPYFVVPWHLLEASHVNFFTQRSLHALLSGWFDSIAFARVGPFDVNGTRVYTSVAAICKH